jgi:tRNA dimethylallyltransferase
MFSHFASSLLTCLPGMHQKKLIVLVGPTAVGKTSVAIMLARHFGTEIISADSRQLFKELNIGTAKPSPAELQLVRHHFINSHSIHDPYDAAQYGRDALILIKNLFGERGELILCGGSGMYIKAVCEGFDDIPDIAEGIREKLMNEYEQHGIKVLQDKMRTLDPEHYREIDNQNPHRLIRALEVIEGTGKSIRSFQKKNKLEHPFHLVKIGLTLPREVLYERIDRRMDEMISQGLFAEAESLYPFRHINALQTVGYQEIFDYIDGKYDREEAVRLLKRNSRRYAKRQMTWFQRDRDVIWTDPNNIDGIIQIILNQS